MEEVPLPYVETMSTLLQARDALASRLTASEKQLERRIGEARSLAIAGKRAEQEAEEAAALAEAQEEAVEFLNSFADERQHTAQQKIEALVTHGLQTVFGEGMEFRIVTEVKAKRKETKFLLRTGQVETPILDAMGGGVAAVTGFLLRLIVLLLTPERRKLLVLDESFGFLSAEYEPRMADLLREVVDQTGVRILLVTHSLAFSDEADTVYHVANRGGRTVVQSDEGRDDG